jgi:hypothetical protein
MLRDNLVGLIAPMQNRGTQALDDESSCLENPRPVGAESSLTGRTSSPFQTEPRQYTDNLPILALCATGRSEQFWVAAVISMSECLRAGPSGLSRAARGHRLVFRLVLLPDVVCFVPFVSLSAFSII